MKKIFSLSFILLFCCSLAFAGLTLNSNSDMPLKAKTPQQNSTAVAKEAAPQSMIATSPNAIQAYTGNVNPNPVPIVQGMTATNPNVAPADKKQGSAPPPDPNMILQGGDNFGTATPIASLPYNDNGTTCGYTNDYDGSCGGVGAPDVVYSYAATSDMNVTVSLCNGTTYDSKLIVYENDSSTEIGCNDDFCGLQSQLTVGVSTGNTYYIVVDGYATNCGSYVIDVYEAPPGPPNDNCVDVTPDPLNIGDVLTYTGNNSNATVDCSLLGWAEVWFAFTTTEQMDVSIDVCGSPTYFGTLGVVYTLDCPCTNYYFAGSYGWTCADGNWELQIYSLPAGTYYYPMYAQAPYVGDYELHITGVGPCFVECPPEGIPEGEVDCYDEYVDDYNGGCNSSPYVFQNYTFGDIVCGTSGTYLFGGNQYRDTDWYRVEITENKLMTLKAVAEFPLQLLLISAMTEDCVTYSYIIGTGAPCDTVTLSMIATPGVYWLWVGPSVFSGVPCPSDYTMSATIEEPPPPPPNDNCVDVTPDPLSGGQTLTYTGNNEFATSDCPLLGWPEVWFAFTTSEVLNVSVDFCTTDPAFQTIGTVITDCPCTQIFMYGTADFTTCGDNNPTVFFYNLPPGTYYYPAYSGSGNTGDYTVHIIGETPPPPPPNDNCVDVVPDPLSDGQTLTYTGNNSGATVDCPILGWPEVWFAFTTSEALNVTIDVCGSPTYFGTLGIVYTLDCPCTNYYFATSYGWTCADGNWEMQILGLPAGTYYYPLYSSPPYVGDYELHISAVAPPPCFPDFTMDAPFTNLSTTCGAGDDCALHLGEDHIYEINIPTDGTWIFSLCGTVIGWDTQLFLGSSCCTSNLGFDDDFCGYPPGNSQITATLSAGTYYLDIEPYSDGDCSDYQLDVTEFIPPPSPCDGAVYINHVTPLTGAYASQCDPVYPFQAGVADDFILAGPDPTKDIVEVDLWTQFWNGVMDPVNVTAVQVTFYADNGGIPGGRPIGTDPACAHQDDMGGSGIISEQMINPPDFSWVAESNGTWQLKILISTVTLNTGVTYWLEVAPVMDFLVGGQIGWTPSDIITGYPAMQIFSIIGYPDWQCESMGCIDMAFCLHTPGGENCVYTPGDINNNGDVNGVDVGYGVNYFKGFGPPPPVDCGDPVGPCPEASPFYAAGDVNANFTFNGVDITYFVNYLKGIGPPLSFAPDCPPAVAAAPGQINPAVQPSKAKIDASDR